MGRPLDDIVETSLIKRIKGLARSLIDKEPAAPRWIFLIGGPGNGKSEAVETFVHELDDLTNSTGDLINTVSRKFEPNPVAPRRVDVVDTELQGSVLRDRLRRLIIIQDASAVDGPDQIAEDALIEDLADLVTCPPGQEPVFICCANRGLLARSLSTIQAKESLDWLNVNDVTEILSQLLTATGLGPGALADDRPECWPLEHDSRFAAWPLDLDSIITVEEGVSPFEQMMSAAIEQQRWEGEYGCSDCSSRTMCPFYVNAAMLRDPNARRALVQLLRHSELATGQRWNFRDSFSLCAELIVGQRDDFSSENGTDTPCQWVHERVDEISHGGQRAVRLSAAWELAFHLYSQSLFPVWLDPADELDKNTIGKFELTRSALSMFYQPHRSRGSQIRQVLSGTFSQKLDPALATPPSSESVLKAVEDEFAQSTRQGLETFRQSLIPLIVELLDSMSLAEEDWIDIVRESSKARAVLQALRILCATLMKRFVGVREGEYLDVEYLFKYESILRDSDRLQELIQPLKAILAPGGTFGGSLIQVYGQPSPDSARDILVTHPLGIVRPRVASESTDKRPGHDVPWIEVRGHHIPLTFELFAALRAHLFGARMASFAPHTRAAVDKVNNAIAGTSARDTDGMRGGDVSIRVGALGFLVPSADGTVRFEGSAERQ